MNLVFEQAVDGKIPKTCAEADYLVELEDGTLEVAHKYRNITIVGGHFAFDKKPISSYAFIRKRSNGD